MKPLLFTLAFAAVLAAQTPSASVVGRVSDASGSFLGQRFQFRAKY